MILAPISYCTLLVVSLIEPYMSRSVIYHTASLYADALFDHDEVLLALADQLGDLTPLIGGSAYAHHLLRPLEQLASMEESAVREKAVESLCKVADKHSVAALEEHFIPLLRRLTRGESSQHFILLLWKDFSVRVDVPYYDFAVK